MWLERRGIPWAPPSGAGQRGGEDMKRFLAKAKSRFADDRELTDGLREYELTTDFLE